MIQEKKDQSRSGHGEKWEDSGYHVKVEPTRLESRLGMEHKRKNTVKDDSKDFIASRQKNGIAII